MAILRIRSEDTGQTWEVWPASSSIPAGSIQETRGYFFDLSGSPHAPQSDLLIDDIPLQALRTSAPNTASWRWTPGFHAGTVECELRLGGGEVRRFEIVTDPDLRKLTRDDFNTMVKEILDDTFALFSLTGFRKGIGKGPGRKPPAIARLEFLRSRVSDLESVVAAIIRNPRRRLTAEYSPLPYHRAIRATGSEIVRSFRTGSVLRESSRPPHLPSMLQGYLPAKVWVRQRRDSLDLPEHRQIAAVLRSWAAWLADAAERLTRAQGDADVDIRSQLTSWALRCRKLSRRIRTLAEVPLFAEAGDSAPYLKLSAIFRRDDAYQRFFRLWQDINLGISSIFGSYLNLPLARTFELYEIWCFLRLLRAAARAWGPDALKVHDLFVRDAGGGVTLAAGSVVVAVGGGWALCFKKQYREFWLESDRRGSFSRMLTPDMVLTRVRDEARGEGTESLGSLIVVDAKYRVGDALGDALNSIHTYRDALVREVEDTSVEGIVSAAYLVAPHIPELRAQYQETPMPGRLFHPEYRASFRFGAVTLRPGMTMTEVTTALKTVVADATVED